MKSAALKYFITSTKRNFKMEARMLLVPNPKPNEANDQTDTPETTNGSQYGGREAKPHVIEPWDKAVDGGAVVEELLETDNVHANIDPDDAYVKALWSVHANIFKVFKATPRLVITAGARGCGKTVVLDMLKPLVTNRYETSNATPALLSTLSHGGDKAFFLDNANRWLRGREQHGDYLNWLETGWQRKAKDLKVTMMPSRNAMEWDQHAAVAIAGIGLEKILGDAVLERSHVIHLTKALQGEIAEPFDDRIHLEKMQILGRKVVRLARDLKQRAAVYDYKGDYPMPTHLINRDRDKWEPLFAIASQLGIQYYERLIKIVQDQPPVEDESNGAELLRWLRQAYDTGLHSGPARVQDLIRLVCTYPSEEYNPFVKWNRKDGIGEEAWIRSRQFTALLKPYNKRLIPATHRPVDGGKPIRSIQWADILDAQERHAPLEEHHE